MIREGWIYPVIKVKHFGEEGENQVTYITTKDTNKVSGKPRETFCSVSVNKNVKIFEGQFFEIEKIHSVKITQTYNALKKVYNTMCNINVGNVIISDNGKNEEQAAYESVNEIIENAQEFENLLPF